jgi:hypothetical protein
MKKSTRNSLEKILKFAAEGKLKVGDGSEGSCVYHDEGSGKFCAIGCLLSAKTLKEVKAKGINGTNSDRLFKDFPNLEKSIGLNAEQALILQKMHDKWALGAIQKRQFIRPIEGLLRGTRSYIQNGAIVVSFF